MVFVSKARRNIQTAKKQGRRQKKKNKDAAVETGRKRPRRSN
jgi:hypothetical protein